MGGDLTDRVAWRRLPDFPKYASVLYGATRGHLPLFFNPDLDVGRRTRGPVFPMGASFYF